jgi:hypothetical protein
MPHRPEKFPAQILETAKPANVSNALGTYFPPRVELSSLSSVNLISRAIVLRRAAGSETADTSVGFDRFSR